MGAAFVTRADAVRWDTWVTGTKMFAPATGSGCNFSTIKTWTVTDGCGNSTTNTQTVNYTRDTDAPVISLTAAATLGCNPTAAQDREGVGTAKRIDSGSPGLTDKRNAGRETE